MHGHGNSMFCRDIALPVGSQGDLKEVTLATPKVVVSPAE